MDGGQRYASWAATNVPLVANEQVLFYVPFQGLRVPASDAEAELVAFGAVRPARSTRGLLEQSKPAISRETLHSRTKSLTLADSSSGGQ